MCGILRYVWYVCMCTHPPMTFMLQQLTVNNLFRGSWASKGAVPPLRDGGREVHPGAIYLREPQSFATPAPVTAKQIRPKGVENDKKK